MARAYGRTSAVIAMAVFSGVITIARAADICICNQLTCDVVPMNCTNGVELDQCGCCHVCARGMHETCGGGQYGPGVCGKGLYCLISANPGDIMTGNEKGVCQELPPDCDITTCDSIATHRCPSDSVLVYNGTQGDTCCRTTYECRCDMSLCRVPRCNLGFVPQIKIPSSGGPGFCCDLYQCNPIGCRSSQGQVYKDQETWKEGDDCTTCRCVNGHAECQAEMCVKTCLNPKPVPGRCCPDCETPRIYPNQSSSKCPDLSDCNITCQTGLQQTPDGCHTCKCKPEGCYKDCRYGYLYNETGHHICECHKQPVTCPSLSNCSKKCNHGYKQSKKGCPKCRCNKCKLFVCDKTCYHGYQRDKFGCKICKCKESLWERNCTVGEDVYLPGQVWRGDNCTSCTCRHDGSILCEAVKCPSLSCTFMVKRDGECCPVCLNVSITHTGTGVTSQKSKDDNGVDPKRSSFDIQDMEEKYIISLSIVGVFVVILLIMVFVLLYLKLKQRHQASWSVAGQDSYCKCPLFIGHSPTLQHKYNINGEIPNKLSFEPVVVQSFSPSKRTCVGVPVMSETAPCSETQTFLSSEEQANHLKNDEDCLNRNQNYSYNKWAAL